MTKIGLDYNLSDTPCFDCNIPPELCINCPFRPLTNINPDEIAPDELIPWSKKEKK